MITPGDAPDAVVRSFLERLLLHTPYRPSGAEPQVLVGQLPPDWDIPLPKDATVVGTHVPMDFHVRVVLDTPGQPEHAIEEVSQALAGGGWRPRERMLGMSGGFVPGRPVPGAMRMFVHERLRRSLTITASPGQSGLVDVRLELNSDPHAFASLEMGDRMGPPHSPMSVLLPLAPPPGMRQGGGGGGSGSGSVHSEATLHGQLSLDTIEKHYREQLLAAGWVLGEHFAGGRWAWSTWDLSDSRSVPWTGILTIAQPRNQASIYVLSVQAVAFQPGMSSGSTMMAGH